MRFVSYVSLYIRKGFSLLLQRPSCFSQLIRKFHSCLSLCPWHHSVLKVESLRHFSIILSFPNTSTATNFFALSVNH